MTMCFKQYCLKLGVLFHPSSKKPNATGPTGPMKDTSLLDEYQQDHSPSLWLSSHLPPLLYELISSSSTISRSLPGFLILIIFSCPPPHVAPWLPTCSQISVPPSAPLALHLISSGRLTWTFNSFSLHTLRSSPWPQLKTADALYVNWEEGATQWIYQAH